MDSPVSITHPVILRQEVAEDVPEEKSEKQRVKQPQNNDDDQDVDTLVTIPILPCRECSEAELDLMSLASHGSFASLAAEFASSIRSCASHSSLNEPRRNTSHISLSSTRGTRSMPPPNNTKNSLSSPTLDFSPQTVIVEMSSDVGEMAPDDTSLRCEKNCMFVARNNSISSTKRPQHPNPIVRSVLSVVDSIEDMRENWRREAFHRHLEVLRTVVKQARVEAVEGSSREANRNRAMSIESLGELGVALFSPLDAAFETDFDLDVPVLSPGDADDLDDDDDFETSSAASDDEGITVQVRFESEARLKSSPHILTLDMMQQMADNGLPSTIAMKRWVRLYSVSRDGDSFGTFLRNVKGHSHTVLVVQTCRGEILGGFADQPWEQHKNAQDGSSYFGTGSSFLFNVKEGSLDRRGRHRSSAFCPMPMFDQSVSAMDVEDELALVDSAAKAFSDPTNNGEKFQYGQPNKDKVIIHKWKGKNNYNQLCHTREGRLAMGGGGEHGTFGFCVQDFFGHGSTGACETYGTTGPLTHNEHFDIVDFEVYGFEHAW